MGYTRYWNRTNKPITTEFVAAVNDVIKECERIGIKLRQRDRNPDPLVSRTIIMLNGDSEKDLSCESFLIDNKNTGFDFCKTRRYPYDYAVREILRIAEKMDLVTDVRSDGEFNDIMSDDEYIRVYRNAAAPTVFNETQTTALKSSAYTAHNLQKAMHDLYETNPSHENKMNQNLNQSIDHMASLFVLMCGTPSNGSATLPERHKPVSDETMHDLMGRFVKFTSGDIDDTNIIEFANKLRDDLIAAENE